MRRRGKQALKVVKDIDAFPKVSESYVETSATGGSVSILTFIFIGILLVSEIIYYTDTELHYEYEVDKDFTGKMKLNIDMTVAMPCGAIGADIVDISGENSHGHGEITEEPTWFEMSTNQRDYHQMMLQINTYMREEYHSLHEVLWAQGPVSHYTMPERTEEPGRPQDACRLHGSFTINKVAGNFHITAGKSMPVLGGGHAHLALGTSSYNFSHRIDHLSFGDTTAGRVNPLDADLKVTDKDHFIYQYFMKVVPTYVNTRHNRLDTYQLAVTEKERKLDHSKGSHGTPGIFFKYDLAAFKVKVEERHKPITEFLVRLCGIVGGIFATSGILNSLVKFCICKLSTTKGSEGVPLASQPPTEVSDGLPAGCLGAGGPASSVQLLPTPPSTPPVAPTPAPSTVMTSGEQQAILQVPEPTEAPTANSNNINTNL